MRFTPHGDGCRVHFEHGGWNDGNGTDRRKFRDWSVLLDRYAALANGDGALVVGAAWPLEARRRRR